MASVHEACQVGCYLYNNQGEQNCRDNMCRMRRVPITEMSGSELLQAHINAVWDRAAQNYWDAVARHDGAAGEVSDG